MAGEWQTTTIPLSETTKFIVDNRGRTAPTVEHGIPLIATNCISNDQLYPAYENLRFVSKETYANWFRSHPLPGDIILTTKGSQNGAICLVPDPVDFVIAQDMVALRTDEKIIDPLFLFAVLRSKDVQREIKNLDVSGVIPHFKKTDFDKLHLPYPKRDVQEAIGRIYFNFSAKIELNRRMNATLEAMARALFQSWFVDFDPVRAKLDGRVPVGMDTETYSLFPDSFQESDTGPIPKGWGKTNIGREVDFFTGFAFQSEQFSSGPNGIRLARGDNVKEGFFHWDSKTRYWPDFTPELERYRLKLGDVLIGMDGSKVGKNWVRVRADDLPCLLVQRVARLRSAQSVGEHFLWLLISDPRFRFHVEAVKTGTSIPHISGGQIKAFDFVRPPIGDQRLFHIFEETVRPLGKQMDAIIGQSLTLATLRDTLLPKLLSGELSVANLEN